MGCPFCMLNAFLFPRAIFVNFFLAIPVCTRGGEKRRFRSKEACGGGGEKRRENDEKIKKDCYSPKHRVQML